MVNLPPVLHLGGVNETAVNVSRGGGERVTRSKEKKEWERAASRHGGASMSYTCRERIGQQKWVSKQRPQVHADANIHRSDGRL